MRGVMDDGELTKITKRNKAVSRLMTSAVMHAASRLLATSLPRADDGRVVHVPAEGEVCTPRPVETYGGRAPT